MKAVAKIFAESSGKIFFKFAELSIVLSFFIRRFFYQYLRVANILGIYTANFTV